ncbi:MAG: glycosyltransferase [Bacteroidales bacterium]|jgi:glycosyltransferase involved in cell wall biosynthesis
MKEILLIHHRLPFPLNNGMDKLRFNLITILAKHYRVTLAAPINRNTKQEWIEKVKSCGIELFTVQIPINAEWLIKFKGFFILRWLYLIFSSTPKYSSENFYGAFNIALLNLIGSKNFYFIQILSDFSGCYLKYLRGNNFIITGPMDDTIEMAQKSILFAKTIPQKLGRIFLYNSIRKYFSEICRMSDLVMFHSEKDLKSVKSNLDFDFEAIILPIPPEQIEKAEEPSDEIEPDSLVFVGGFGAIFNQDAAEHLVRDILPLIKRKTPNVILYLVGDNPPGTILNYQADKNIIVTGFVDDVKTYIRKSAVFVSAVRIGTGIKTKTIEALSMSKAMVVSSASLQGLWETDSSIFICDENNEFAEKVISILSDPILRKKQEKRSAELFNRAYSFSYVSNLMINIYSNIQIRKTVDMALIRKGPR